MKINVGGSWKSPATTSVPVMCGSCNSNGCQGGCSGGCGGQCKGSGCSSYCNGCRGTCVSVNTATSTGQTGNPNTSGSPYNGAYQTGTTTKIVPPKINVSGTWKEVTSVKQNVGGTWKNVSLS